MAVLRIKIVGDPILRRKARKVEAVDAALQRLLADMVETMHEANGIGLAGPQIGVPRRVIVVDIGDGPIKMVNPRIVESQGCATGPEGCLSIPGLTGQVERFERVVVKGLDDQGQPLRVDADGLLSIVFQHEIDHLDGVLFTDKATELRDGTRDEAGPEEEEAETSRA